MANQYTPIQLRGLLIRYNVEQENPKMRWELHLDDGDVVLYPTRRDAYIRAQRELYDEFTAYGDNEAAALCDALAKVTGYFIGSHGQEQTA